MLLRDYLDYVERAYLQQVLTTVKTREEAADKLGVSLRTLYYKLKKHRLTVPHEPTAPVVARDG